MTENSQNTRWGKAVQREMRSSINAVNLGIRFW